MALKIYDGENETHEPTARCDREAARQLVDAYIRETTEAYKNQLLFEVRPKDHDAGRQILGLPREQQVAIVVEAAARLARSGALHFESQLPLRFLLSALLRRNLPFDQSSIESLLLMLRVDGDWWHLSPAGVLRRRIVHREVWHIADDP